MIGNFISDKSSYEVLLFLESEGMKVNYYHIDEAARIGNLFLIKYFLEKNQIPKDILVSTSDSGNTELVKFILDQEGIDINAIYLIIFINIYLYYLVFQNNIWKFIK